MTLPMCPLAWPHHMCCTAPWRMFWAREGSPRAGEWLETEGGSDLRPLDVLRTLEKAPSDVLPRLLLDKHLKHSKRLCRVFRRALSGFQRGSQGRSWDTRPDAQERDWEGEEGEKDQKPPIADGGRADAGEASTGAREEGRMAWSVSLTVSGFPGCGAPCFATAVGEASPCADKEGALAEGRAGKRALAALLAGAGLRVAGEDETPVEVAVARTAAERDTEKGGALFGEERRGGGQGGRAGGAVLGGTGGRGHDRYKSAAGGEGEGAEVAEGTRAKGGGEGKRKGGKGRGEQPQGLAESADLRPLLARARRELSVGHQALVGAGHGAGDGAAGAGGETCAADAETKLSREGGAAEQSGSHGGKAVAVQAMVMEGTAMHRTLVIELRGNKGSGNGDRSSPSAAALTEELRMLLDRISESGVSSVAGAWVVMGAGQGRPGDPAVLAVYVLSCVPSNCDVERAAHEALGMNWRGVDGST